MKIRYVTLLEWGILVCCILLLGFTSVSANEIIGKNTAKLLVCSFSIASTIIVLYLSKNDFTFLTIKKFLNKYCLIYTFAIIVIFLYSLIAYKYKITDLISNAAAYLFVYMAYPIAYVFNKKGNMNNLMQKVSVLVIVMLAIKAYAWYLYNYKGVTISQSLIFEFGRWDRTGTGDQRINAGYLVGLSIVFLLCYQGKSMKRIASLVSAFFIILFIIYITAFRSQIIATFFTCIVIFYLLAGSNKRVLFRRLTIFGVLVVMVTSRSFYDFINSFMINGSYIGQSTLIRLNALKHYANLFVDRFAFLGLGLIGKGSANAYELMIPSYGGVFWLEDLGIIGGFFRYGIFAFFLYGYIFYHAIKICLQLRNCKTQNRAIVFGITFYMILSCLAMNMFDGQRILDVPFYLAIIAYMKSTVSVDTNLCSKKATQ